MSHSPKPPQHTRMMSQSGHHRLTPSVSSDQLRQRASISAFGQISSSPSSSPDVQLRDSVRSFHVLNVIQSNDISIILPACAEILREEMASASFTSTPSTSSFGSPLHLAVALCSRHVTEQIVKLVSTTAASATRPVPWVNDKNYPDMDTPLHIASKLGSLETVELLLKIDGIDDTVKNAQGLVAEDCFLRSSVHMEHASELFKREKHLFISKNLQMFRSYIESRNSRGIVEFLTSNRRVGSYFANGYMDINAVIDPSTDMTLLHFGAREESVQLVEWVLANGGDPDIKDRKGRKPLDVLPRTADMFLKEMLKSAVAQPSILSSQLGLAGPLTKAPFMSGTCKKWVNYSSGWKSRYLVLENAQFSYYKSEADYPLSCRGSIATRIATIEFPDAKDKCRFDVVGKGSVRFSLLARSPADAKKWVWMLMESKKWALDQTEASPIAQGAGNDALPSDDDDEEREVEGMGPRLAADASGFTSDASGSPRRPVNTPGHQYHLAATDANVHRISFSSHTSQHHGSNRLDVFPATFSDDLTTLAHLLQSQMDVQSRVVDALVDSLVNATQGVSTSSGSSQSGSFLRDVDLSNLPSLMQSSVRQVSDTVGRILALSEARDRKWRKRYSRALVRIGRLEAIIQGAPALADPEADVAESRERQEPFDLLDESPQMRVPGALTADAQAANDEDSDTDDGMLMADAVEDLDVDVFYETNNLPSIHENEILPQSLKAADANYIQSERVEKKPPLGMSLAEANLSQSLPRMHPLTAKESNNVKDPTPTLEASSIFPTDDALQISMRGHLPVSKARTRLPLDPTKPKPVFQVWSFIRSAIGKDLSKVPLPVFFNEPISMLQRMGEDIEYVELLSLASKVGVSNSKFRSTDPAAVCARSLSLDIELLSSLRGEEAQLVRLMYVAAYAMSNYSSTVNRTAYLLSCLTNAQGETFELVDDEKQFRYVSEQPISACYADSRDWVFWTEVNAKSKFWGSSLEIHPLGNCHVSLPVPSDCGIPSQATEHYTWKKVTTTVNNLIVGKLSISHLGDMVIRNWRTGEECQLTFRPRQTSTGASWFGWGSSDKGLQSSSGETKRQSTASLNDSSGEDMSSAVGEIVGVVRDRNGIVRWNVVGSWGDRLTATRASTVSSRQPSEPNKAPSPLNLWIRKHPPAYARDYFNQTLLACSLNELPASLMQYLPPTDSRLRHDQRAMEEGRWEDANRGKEVLENVQRARRKLLVKGFETTKCPSGPTVSEKPDEEIGEPWWTPRWFVRKKDEVTGEMEWKFTGQYWAMRERKVSSNVDWADFVLPIFNDVK